MWYTFCMEGGGLNPIETGKDESPKINWAESIDFAEAKTQFEANKDPKPQEPTQIYCERISENLEYLVYLYVDNDDDRKVFEFQIVEDREKSTNKKWSEFVFKDTDKGLNLSHRLVRSKENFGITGTSLLKKSESYFKFLRSIGYLNDKPLLLEAGQVGVIKWAVDYNGFVFDSQSMEDLYRSIGTNENYVTDVVDTTEPDIEKTGYILNKGTHEKWLKDNEQREKEGKKLFSARGVSIRFLLHKDF